MMIGKQPGTGAFALDVKAKCQCPMSNRDPSAFLVAPKKYGAVLYASPETVSQGKWGPLKEAYYNE
jgi:hypothetical protein